MNKLLLMVVACFMAAATFAQAPESFNFQAVARDASGNIIPNKPVSFRISIRQTTSTGTTVYQETHTANTNQYGLVNLSIGSGNVVTGTFSAISWGTAKYFLKIDMDANGGSSYTDMGTQQLVSVPYALNAETAKTVTNSDNDTTNEIQALSKSGTNVTLSKGGGTVSVADNDNNSTNEIQTLSKSGLNVSLSNGGGTVSVADNDNSTTNEIQKISIVGTNLSLDKTGGTVPINNLNHWKKTGTALNYTAGQVGIGTSFPAYKLHVLGSGDTSTAYFYNGSSGGSAVKGASNNGPTNGYLGVQSQNGMDNNPLIKFPGLSGKEVGVLGVSTGTSAGDNIGVMGLTNGGYPGYFKNTGNGNQVSIGTGSYGLSVDTGKLGVNGIIEHVGDANTYVSFTDDQIDFYAGANNLLRLDEGTTDYVHMASTVGSSVGIGSASSNKKLNIFSTDADLKTFGLDVFNSRNGVNTDLYGLEGEVYASGNNYPDLKGASGRARNYGISASTSVREAHGGDFYAYMSSFNGTSHSYGLYSVYGGNADIEYAGYFTGRVYSTVGYTTSDMRLKTNIANLNSSLDKIMTLPVKTYDFRTKEYAQMNLPEGNHTGIMAQDLEKIYPELVSKAMQPAMDSIQQVDMINAGQVVPESAKSEVEFKAVNYTGLVPHLVKATQEQQVIIDAQKKKLAEQAKAVELLKAQMAEQQKLLLELKAQMAKNNKG